MDLFEDYLDYGYSSHSSSPVIGSATLSIKGEMDALFISAEWTIRARVNGTVICEGVSYSKPSGQDAMSQWARAYIRNNKQYLRDLGVDCEKSYIEHGGDINDF